MKKMRKEITLRAGESVEIAPGVRLHLLAPRPGFDFPGVEARIGVEADRSVPVRRAELGDWQPGRKGGAA